MKILILDDDKFRHQQFIHNFSCNSENDIIGVYTVDEAIKLLESNIYDIIFLDHDLGGAVYVDSDGEEPTGYTVAKWMVEHPERIPKHVYIHSLNPVGAQRIKQILPNSVIAPGLWMISQGD